MVTRYDHTGIVARDVEHLAAFYEKVFACVPASPPRSLTGDLVGRGVGVPEVELRGMWLLLPGHGNPPPILELFEYSKVQERDTPPPNQFGFNHISFEVDDVHETAGAVIAAGGSQLGEIVDYETPSGKVLRYVYMRDPEGNVVELEQTLSHD